MLKKIAIGLCAYAALAVTIYRCPLLHRGWRERQKQKFPFNVTVIAHRGGSLIGPENTLYTFRKAVADGRVDMLELDVHESKDGKIVVCHDRILERICGPEYANVSVNDIVVGNSPSTTLPQVHREVPLHFPFGEVQNFSADASVPVDDSTRICLLTEVFDALPGVPLHIDIKDASFSFTKNVLDLIETYKRETITFVGTSNMDNTANVKRYFKECPKEKRQRFRILCNTHEYFTTCIKYYLGILPFMKLDMDVMSIPVHTSTMREDAKVMYGYFSAIIGSYFLSNPHYWEYLQKRGLVVLGWVLNDDQDFAEAIRYPLNGIMSDVPTHLADYLEEHSDEVRLNRLH